MYSWSKTRGKFIIFFIFTIFKSIYMYKTMSEVCHACLGTFSKILIFIYMFLSYCMQMIQTYCVHLYILILNLIYQWTGLEWIKKWIELNLTYSAVNILPYYNLIIKFVPFGKWLINYLNWRKLWCLRWGTHTISKNNNTDITVTNTFIKTTVINMSGQNDYVSTAESRWGRISLGPNIYRAEWRKGRNDFLP